MIYLGIFLLVLGMVVWYSWYMNMLSKAQEPIESINFQYYTQDGHLMEEREIMWRICNSEGTLFEKPERVMFGSLTGYNCWYKSNEEQGYYRNRNPYAANHLHYFSFAEAARQLDFRKKSNQ